MPELWLNYGNADIVLDIQAENLHSQIHNSMNITQTSHILEKLNSIDIKESTNLVIFEDTKPILQIVFMLFEICNKNSNPLPKILVPQEIIHSIRNKISQTEIKKFSNISEGNFIFINDLHFDGLFGFSTTATNLLKKLGSNNSLLSAYRKRSNNFPMPGKHTIPFKMAQEFTSSFEIVSIEIINNSDVVCDIIIGHPSSMSTLSKSLVSTHVNIDKQNALIINYGKANISTLGNTLESLWNCSSVIANNGLAILISDCSSGIGSTAIQYFVEKRFNIDSLKDPVEYIAGMENLLFLTELQKKIRIGLVSVLPYFYLNQLNIIPFQSGNDSLNYILNDKTVGKKITVIFNASRTLLK